MIWLRHFPFRGLATVHDSLECGFSLWTLLKHINHHLTVLTSTVWSLLTLSNHWWMSIGTIFTAWRNSIPLLHMDFHVSLHFAWLLSTMHNKIDDISFKWTLVKRNKTSQSKIHYNFLSHIIWIEENEKILNKNKIYSNTYSS